MGKANPNTAKSGKRLGHKMPVSIGEASTKAEKPCKSHRTGHLPGQGSPGGNPVGAVFSCPTSAKTRWYDLFLFHMF
ncbi:hypothetical protein DPMN_132836 [Dreissena polymorpha]|uniref:Uncharacterized protein n=1 Tax=Dreissena polymorpha TaxID=45954 RepID=A0A9D4FSD8_DREPO|nr:hypothetical protein DPMN_132836 [Dreissena polymorpha]